MSKIISSLTRLIAKRNLYKSVYTSRKGMEPRTIVIIVLALFTLVAIAAFVMITNPELVSSIKRAFATYLTP